MKLHFSLALLLWVMGCCLLFCLFFNFHWIEGAHLMLTLPLVLRTEISSLDDLVSMQILSFARYGCIF